MATSITVDFASGIKALRKVLRYAIQDWENYEALRFLAQEEEKENYDPKFLFGDEIADEFANVARLIDSADELKQKIGEAARTIELSCTHQTSFWKLLCDVLFSKKWHAVLKKEKHLPRKEAIKRLLLRLNSSPPTLECEVEAIRSDFHSAVELVLFQDKRKKDDSPTTRMAKKLVRMCDAILVEARKKNNDDCRFFAAVAQEDGLNAYKIRNAEMIVGLLRCNCEDRTRCICSGGIFLHSLVDFAEMYLSDYALAGAGILVRSNPPKDVGRQESTASSVPPSENAQQEKPKQLKIFAAQQKALADNPIKKDDLGPMMSLVRYAKVIDVDRRTLQTMINSGEVRKDESSKKRLAALSMMDCAAAAKLNLKPMKSRLNDAFLEYREQKRTNQKR